MDQKEIECVGNSIGDSISRIVEIAIEARGGWPLAIPVSERLPLKEDGEIPGDTRGPLVLAFVVDGNNTMDGWELASYSTQKGWKIFGPHNSDGDFVTHWMPLPPAPTQPAVQSIPPE